MKILLALLVLVSAWVYAKAPESAGTQMQSKVATRTFSGDTTLEGAQARLEQLRADRLMAKEADARKHIDAMIYEQEQYISRLKSEGMHHPAMR